MRPHRAVTWDTVRLVEVTATVPHGAVLDPSWPAPLDGVLAAAARRDRLGDLYGTTVDHHVERTGLARLELGTRNSWSWAATCAQPIDHAGDEVRWWHHRTDEQAALDRPVSMPKTMRAGIGRYRAWRMPLVVTVCSGLRWYAIGDPTEIRRLVDRVDAIGKKRSQGEGHVTDWAVTDIGDPDTARVCWHDDGHIARPIAARHRAHLGVPDAETALGCYRPPYWRPAQHADGTAHRVWREVIAPWTTRQSASTAA